MEKKALKERKPLPKGMGNTNRNLTPIPITQPWFNPRRTTNNFLKG